MSISRNKILICVDKGWGNVFWIFSSGVMLYNTKRKEKQREGRSWQLQTVRLCVKCFTCIFFFKNSASLGQIFFSTFYRWGRLEVKIIELLRGIVRICDKGYFTPKSILLPYSPCWVWSLNLSPVNKSCLFESMRQARNQVEKTILFSLQMSRVIICSCVLTTELKILQLRLL